LITTNWIVLNSGSNRFSSNARTHWSLSIPIKTIDFLLNRHIHEYFRYIQQFLTHLFSISTVRKTSQQVWHFIFIEDEIILIKTDYYHLHLKSKIQTLASGVLNDSKWKLIEYQYIKNNQESVRSIVNIDISWNLHLFEFLEGLLELEPKRTRIYLKYILITNLIIFN
jgi:hypothetical protein